MDFVEDQYADLVAQQLEYVLLDAWIAAAREPGGALIPFIPQPVRAQIVSHARDGAGIPQDVGNWTRKFAADQVQLQLAQHRARKAEGEREVEERQAAPRVVGIVGHHERALILPNVVAAVKRPQVIAAAAVVVVVLAGYQIYFRLPASTKTVEVPPTLSGPVRRDGEAPVNSALATVQPARRPDTNAPISPSPPLANEKPSASGVLPQSAPAEAANSYPTGFGSWRILKLADGRPYAYARPIKMALSGPNGETEFRELRLECVAGAKLEFVVMTRNGLARKLYYDDPGDDPSFDPTIRIANGRVSGAAAARLSKSFLESERGGGGGYVDVNGKAVETHGTVPLSIDANSMRTDLTAMFDAGGFTSSRKFLLEECGRIDRATRAAVPQTVINRTGRDGIGDSVVGEAGVVTTGAILVEGRKIALQGVDGFLGNYADQFRAFLREQGGRVTCDRVIGEAYRCRTTSNVDLATAVLFNGSGRALPDAPEDLKRAEQSARQRKAGFWSSN